ncbi:HAMP domain-containing sensor histidine kinase [Oceanirhabdus sp. W0125-5]|uniref:HAMP domain-containing sensor histidine kinase n=1 Tax=Oceanirhabdus sp. W0125-5 TaxID=2999116 RepID=UPI0022F2CB6B|nr:HAMP domain-containing sensor histidine kinase [Oceanirhabdus sp. W0125-5]WBW95601.1 HAMP domain-containing sensor histidine kinase [Oceanirhabdus sp. W0125-5]
MSIRTKLIGTYIIMVMVAAILFITTTFTAITLFFTDAGSTLIQDKKLDEVVVEIVDLFVELKVKEENNPSSLLDEVYIKEVNNKIRDYSCFLTVEYNGEFIDVGGLNLSNDFYDTLLKEDKSYKFEKLNIRKNKSFMYNKDRYNFIKYEFKYDSKVINYYFIIDMSVFKNIRGGYGKIFSFVLLVILLIIILPLTYMLSKDIIIPLKKLEEGANKIKEGNLDFELKTKSNNEIGRVIQAFETMRCELKKSVEQQIQYEENRKELISSISHDLKTPITSIKGYVEGIMDGVANSEEKLEKYLQVIYNKSEHMDKLINDLFLFSRLDLNRLPFEMEEVYICRFMDDCINELKLEYSKQNIIINYNTNVDVNTIVIMDSQKIKRVIFNIVQNAIKFMNKDEKVLNIELREDEILNFVIKDNGIGIEKEQLPLIFDKFYRVDEARNTKVGGTGLGLAIAKQIIDAHKGEIWAESEIEEGTSICFTLQKVVDKGDSHE